VNALPRPTSDLPLPFEVTMFPLLPRAAFALALLCALVGPAAASPHTTAPTKIVRVDMGGDVGRRGNAVAAMRQRGEWVRIEGTCISACTLYVALEGTCVAPNARLGFHAPGYYGRKATPERVAFWTKVVADHYPPLLRAWYLSHASTSKAVVSLTAPELIALGVPACAAR